MELFEFKLNQNPKPEGESNHEGNTSQTVVHVDKPAIRKTKQRKIVWQSNDGQVCTLVRSSKSNKCVFELLPNDCLPRINIEKKGLAVVATDGGPSDDFQIRVHVHSCPICDGFLFPACAPQRCQLIKNATIVRKARNKT